MKGKTLSAFGLLAILVGAAMIFFNNQISKVGIIVAGGVLFVAAGLINLIMYGHSQKGSGLGRLLGQLANAAAIVFGICLLVFSSSFEPLIAFIFGIFIAVCALFQFFMLAIGARPHQLPGWLYVFPLLLTGAAVYIFIQRDMTESLLLIVTGASVATAGLGWIFEGASLGMARRAAASEAESKKEIEPEDDKKELEAPKTEPTEGEHSEK